MRIVWIVLLCLWPLTQAGAQEEMPAWQESITGQILALRQGDAEAALGFAGAGFRESYDDAERFVADVESSGYGPIIESRSHSFGAHRELGTGLVMQVVNLIGPDQGLWEAIYQMAEEPEEGWRVQGVVLRRAPGLGI